MTVDQQTQIAEQPDQMMQPANHLPSYSSKLFCSTECIPQ